MIENGKDRLGSGPIAVKRQASFMFRLTWLQDPFLNGLGKLLLFLSKTKLLHCGLLSSSLA